MRNETIVAWTCGHWLMLYYAMLPFIFPIIFVNGYLVKFATEFTVDGWMSDVCQPR